MTIRVDLEARQELQALSTGGCINCGACTAICPLPHEEVLLPRQILRHLHLGQPAELAARAESISSCLLCRLCEESCPAGVDIAAGIRLLRVHLNRRVHGIVKEE
jgi:heterodisulfide reductase subunit C